MANQSMSPRRRFADRPHQDPDGGRRGLNEKTVSNCFDPSHLKQQDNKTYSGEPLNNCRIPNGSNTSKLTRMMSF
jgi:hypothetical protein